MGGTQGANTHVIRKADVICWLAGVRLSEVWLCPHTAQLDCTARSACRMIDSILFITRHLPSLIHPSVHSAAQGMHAHLRHSTWHQFRPPVSKCHQGGGGQLAYRLQVDRTTADHATSSVPPSLASTLYPSSIDDTTRCGMFQRHGNTYQP